MSYPHGPGRRAVLRGAALTTGAAVLGGAALLGPASPAAAAPSVHGRAAWGARPPSSPVQVLASPPLYIVVHHTATANSTDHSLAHAYSLSRAIQNHHMDTNGWADTGQQLTISRGGHVMEGRDRTLPAIAAGQHVVGAHVAGNNSTCVGIENEGTYTSVAPTAPLRDSLVETLAWLCAAYGLNPRSAILGHRDFNATACPGDVLYAMLPELRDAVAGLLAARGVEAAADRPVPADLRPSYPPVPDEPWREFDHGPAHGPDDITR
ncbi:MULTISPECIES: peptidoglycan recognition protein family protein [Nocardiopsis]|uniref:N-acetylmuramoyl-L-alanine amidase n=1 Tax=Nocardiopsis changdeensis TaxID=2831969 RepID=A0ABX8BHB2_9ACTN|nr:MULTISPECIES: peptidoglycan recognition family protein [Nocardiopsis]QUX20233.1 N-acetylmuramoyl-L-alanine amidase [Nocardiopsis changdeensis]QYX36162.1 peptidoglycan recognition protein family protein [Nocardiopsis sp. MT53]